MQIVTCAAGYPHPLGVPHPYVREGDYISTRRANYTEKGPVPLPRDHEARGAPKRSRGTQCAAQVHPHGHSMWLVHWAGWLVARSIWLLCRWSGGRAQKPTHLGLV